METRCGDKKDGRDRMDGLRPCLLDEANHSCSFYTIGFLVQFAPPEKVS